MTLQAWAARAGPSWRMPPESRARVRRRRHTYHRHQRLVVCVVVLMLSETAAQHAWHAVCIWSASERPTQAPSLQHAPRSFQTSVRRGGRPALRVSP